MEPMTFDTPDGLDLDIRIPAGSVQLRASDTKQTRVNISGERNPEDVIVRFTPESNGVPHLLIEQKRKGAFDWFGRLDDLNVELEIPRGSAVDAAVASADVVISGEVGTLELRSASGDLTFESVSGPANIKVASGDVRGGAVGGDLSVQNTSGDLRIQSVEGSSRLNSVSGDIEIARSGNSVHAHTVSGDVELKHIAAGEVEIRTVSGDVTVCVAPGRRVWLDLTSMSGNTTSELGPGGESGEGGEKIRATSLSGDILVQRASETPSQPVAS